jgi:type I restriction enzyme R subunit
MTEDRLVQATTAAYFRDVLGWDSIYAYNDEVLGADGVLGRRNESEVVLTRELRAALERLNPGLPADAYDQAVRLIVETSAVKSLVQINREKYDYYRNGMPVAVKRPDGSTQDLRLRVFDFGEPANNRFLVVRELWVAGYPYRRRPDILGFVNGIPLLFIELKNVHKDIRHAYDKNLADYRDTIPHLFDHNAFILLSNGQRAKVGTITSQYGHFHEWKRLAEDQQGVVDLETALRGLCSKANFMDIFENFLLFDESSGKVVKIMARNHQFLGVNRAVEAVRNRESLAGKLGVFWHTQGSGKSYSMVFFSEKVRRKLTGNFTFLVVTDREDLEKQIYNTYVGVGAVNPKEPCRAGDGDHLQRLFQEDHAYVFTLIHKFNKPVDPLAPYSGRRDIIVISDEAHRTQYGRLAINMRAALPAAHYIGFTGTPLFKDDELTRRIFGDYVSTYDFQRAVDDQATVPLYYDNRGDKLGLAKPDLNQRIAEVLEQTDLDPDQERKVRRLLGQNYRVFTSKQRLDRLAHDFVWHYTAQWEAGKAMLVCLDKVTAVRMVDLVQHHWAQRIKKAQAAVKAAPDEQEQVYRERQLKWLRETEIAVVISEEQNEVALFREYGLDIVPHRVKIKTGYETADGKRIDIDLAFKDPDHPFRVAIVCAMWLTGFDVPSLANLYLDKPLKAHTLMQAIARANRVFEGKENGLIVDYCGVLAALREALATFAVRPDAGSGEGAVDPVRPPERLVAALDEAFDEVRAFLTGRGFDLDAIIRSEGFARIAAIEQAKEAINENDESRKRFELLAEAVGRKYRACINLPELPRYYLADAAVGIVYKALQEDVLDPDVAAIMARLQPVIDAAVAPATAGEIYAIESAGRQVREAQDDAAGPYDISKIDFERLRREFAKRANKRTEVQTLKTAIDRRVQQMIAQNPGRTDYQQRFQEIIDAYNREKDRPTIEATFEALLRFLADLDDEARRGVREGLSEEHLAVFDRLVEGKELTRAERERVKQVARELLDALKAEKLRIERWAEKEATKAEVKTFISEWLWSDQRGLPLSYSQPEVAARAERVFTFVFAQYGGQRVAEREQMALGLR